MMRYAIITLIAALAASALAAPALAAEEREMIYRTSVGGLEVDILFEDRGRADGSVLIGATDEDRAKFIPDGYDTAVAIVMVRTDSGPVLIDTGFGRRTDENLAAFGLTSADVKAILLTHSHGDHIGGLLKDGARAFPNARVFAPRAEYGWSAKLRDALAPYGEDVTLFDPGTLDAPAHSLVQSLRPIAAYGHTPGHTIYMMEWHSERLLIWGDLTHAMAIQMPRPGVSVTYDDDPGAAAAARRAVLEFAARTGCDIAGMHVPFPSVGRVTADPDNEGGYIFIPQGTEAR